MDLIGPSSIVVNEGGKQVSLVSCLKKQHQRYNRLQRRQQQQQQQHSFTHMTRQMSRREKRGTESGTSAKVPLLLYDRVCRDSCAYVQSGERKSGSRVDLKKDKGGRSVNGDKQGFADHQLQHVKTISRTGPKPQHSVA